VNIGRSSGFVFQRLDQSAILSKRIPSTPLVVFAQEAAVATAVGAVPGDAMLQTEAVAELFGSPSGGRF